MNALNSETNRFPGRGCRTADTHSNGTKWLFSAALAALVIAGGTPRLWACDFEVSAGPPVSLEGDMTVDCVSVAADACLIIVAGTLTLHSQATSTIDGNIILEGCDSVLRIAANHSLTGKGAIEGRCDAAAIEIGGGKTLTSAITIRGTLRIRPRPDASNTAFVNASGGLVHANAAGVLDVRPNAVSGAGDWRVSTDASAVLQFRPSTSDLAGRFDVDYGLLGILGQVCTTGVLDVSAGRVEVAPGGVLRTGGSCPCRWPQ